MPGHMAKYKLRTLTFQAPPAIECEKVISRSGVKLLDLQGLVLVSQAHKDKI